MIAICKKCLNKQDVDTSSVKGKVVRYNCEKCDTPNLFVLPPQAKEAKKKVVKIKIEGFSIKTKITLIIVALVVSSITVVGLIASYKGGEALTTQAENHLALITLQKSNEYNAIFERLQNEIEGATDYASMTFARPMFKDQLNFDVLLPWTGNGYGNVEMREIYSYDIAALQRVGIALHGQVSKNPYIKYGYMASTSNILVDSDEAVIVSLSDLKAYIPTERDWYKRAIKAEKTIWTKPYIDASSKQLIVTCASPVWSKSNTIIGVLAFDVLLDTIQKDILTLDIGYPSQAFLVGQDGGLLAKPKLEAASSSWQESVKTDNLLETKDKNLKDIVKKMISGQHGVTTHIDPSKNTDLIAYAPIPAIEASVGITVNKDDVLKPALEIQKLILGVWVVVIIISIFIGAIIGNGISKPINEIIRRADLISQGQTDLDVMTSKRKDEIGVLVDSFNRLITSLKIALSIKR
ncbi:MAG: cache domain-containing protein [Desulfotalea sp.]